MHITRTFSSVHLHIDTLRAVCFVRPSFGEAYSKFVVKLDDITVFEGLECSSAIRVVALSIKYTLIAFGNFVLDLVFAVTNIGAQVVILVCTSTLSYYIMLKKDGIENLGKNLRCVVFPNSSSRPYAFHTTRLHHPSSLRPYFGELITPC